MLDHQPPQNMVCSCLFYSRQGSNVWVPGLCPAIYTGSLAFTCTGYNGFHPSLVFPSIPFPSRGFRASLLRGFRASPLRGFRALPFTWVIPFGDYPQSSRDSDGWNPARCVVGRWGASFGRSSFRREAEKAASGSPPEACGAQQVFFWLAGSGRWRAWNPLESWFWILDERLRSLE